MAKLWPFSRANIASSPKVKTASYFTLLFATGATTFDHALLAVGVVAAIGAGIPFPLLGILFGQLVDNLDAVTCSPSAESAFAFSSSIVTKVLLVVYVSIANFALIYLHTFSWSLIGERLVRRLRTRYLAALLRQDLAFFDNLPSGEVATRLDGDLQSIQTGTSEKVGIVISSISYFVTAYIVAFIKAPRLAGMLFCIVPAFFLMAVVGGHWVKKYSSAATDHVASATGIASAGLLNMSIVHAFGANAKLEEVFAAHLGKAQVEGIKKAFVGSVQLGLLYFIAYSANALAFWQGSQEIANSVANSGSGTSIGGVYTVIFILIDASFIISQVAPFMQLFGTAAAAYSKLVTTINRPSDIDGTSENKGTLLESVSGDIEIQNVSFSYPSRPDVMVLKDVSLKIPANQHTGIVGLSGSGKSTLAALIGRLYDPSEGSILIDGHNLRELNVRSIRRFVGTVSQNSDLFNRSILENIAHGLVNSPSAEHAHLQATLIGPDLQDLVESVRNGEAIEDVVSASTSEVQQIFALIKQATMDANALDFIENFHHGFATSVGSTGGQLSGGQKQRVVLARALVRQPRILILDEATAALDSASERVVQEALERVTDDQRTTITIAHRLSTIKNAHNIVVMRDGVIVEQGSHADLMEANGAFAAMVKLQSVGSVEGSLKSRQNSLDVRERSKNDAGPSVMAESSDHLAEKDEAVSGDDETAKSIVPLRPAISNFSGVLSMARPYFGFILLGISASIIVGGSYSGEAVIFGRTIGELSACRGAPAIRKSGALYGLLFFILAVVEFFANIISTSSFGRVAEKLLTKVRVILLRFLFQQDIQWHESEGRTPSNLLTYISSDASALSGLTGTILGVILAILVNLIAGIVLAHIIAWKIAVVLLSMIPILLASGFLRIRIAASFHVRHQKAFAHSVGLATEAVQSIQTIASFSLEKEALNVYERSLSEPYNATLKSIAYGNFWLAMAYSVANLVYALAYWWGAKQIVAGLYNPTQFFTVLPALLFSAQSGGQLLSLAPDVSKATVAAGRVLALINGKLPSSSSHDDAENPFHDYSKYPGSDLEAAHGLNEKLPLSTDIQQGSSVSFNDVTFSYPSRPSHAILNSLSLDIAPNQFIAITGPSGCGKSTIISLLERFYKPSSGQIIIDNHNISSTSSVAFRDTIALVPQSSALFEGTLHFNLALGARPGTTPTQSEIESACKLANIHDTIMELPLGYLTPCGSSGNQFSGGQMQRLSIARALIRQPRLLLLDESTSALDAESENMLQQALARCTERTTVICVAHRYSTIRSADRIFVIGGPLGGSVEASGTHEELLVQSESYREGVALQAVGV